MFHKKQEIFQAYANAGKSVSNNDIQRICCLMHLKELSFRG